MNSNMYLRRYMKKTLLFYYCLSLSLSATDRKNPKCKRIFRQTQDLERNFCSSRVNVVNPPEFESRTRVKARTQLVQCVYFHRAIS